MLLFIAGCKKEDVSTPETRIEQLKNQVSYWYYSVKNGGTTNPGSITQEIKSNSIIQQSSSEYAFLQVDSLNFNSAYINFDSSKLTGLSVPIKTDIKTGEYIQLSTLNFGNKTKGYFVRSIPEANWYKVLGVKSDFTKMSGRIFVYNIKGKLISNAILVDGVVSNNSSTNQSKTNGNQLGGIKSNSSDYGESSVSVNCYIRHRSWYSVISLAIFDSGNDLGIPLGGNYTPFVPFDPIYGAPSGGGGTINLPPVDPLDAIYNCNCNCAEEDDGTNDLSESFEPKWGQLGTLNNILTEVRKNISQIPNFQTINFENQLNGMRNYFEANRMFTRDNQNNFIDDFTNGSKKIDRYIYTFDLGWIDMHHFFYAAYLAEKYNVVASNSITSYAEILQQLKGNESAFSYEDLQSNSAGIDFYKKYASILRNKNISLETALDSYFTTVNATDPSNSPNYNYIPHIIDGFYAKNISIKGLIGSQLFEAAYEAYCKKPTSRKQSIKEAHIKIKHSSN